MDNWKITVNGGQNQFANTIYNGTTISSTDQKLIDIIKKEVPDKESRESLIDDLLSMKRPDSEPSPEKSAKENRIKKFFDSGLTEAAKLSARQIFESAPEYIQLLKP